MSRRELETEIINLKSTSSAQLLKIENYEQKLYDLKRQLTTSKAMEEHLSAEIESLQKQEGRVNDELLKKLSALEEEIHNLKQTNTENVQYYEVELQNKNIELESIKKSKSDFNIVDNKDEINKYTDEIYDLKLKIEDLSQQLLDNESNYQGALAKNNLLENQITDLISQISDLKDCLQTKKEELEESKELVRNMQDDILVMQMEIDKFKALPMEKATKGNSLFAEVDDSRVELQKTMETMKRKYKDIRTQYSRKCQELNKFHMEYAALIKIIECKNDASDEKCDLIQTYERHFERLSEHVKVLEAELDVQKNAFEKLISKDWKCAQDMITVTRDEVLKLQKKLNADSSCLLTSESNHYKTKRELKKWQADAAQLRSQIVLLNQTVEDLKLVNSSSATNTVENSDIKNIHRESCLKNSGPLFTKIEDWDLFDEKFSDNSILHLKLNDDSQTKLNFTAKDNDIEFDTFLKHIESSSQKDEKVNKENQYPENISTNFTLNDTVDNLVYKMKKVSFDEKVVEPTGGRIGGRKIINVKPIHIPSIKRN